MRESASERARSAARFALLAQVVVAKSSAMSSLCWRTCSVPRPQMARHVPALAHPHVQNPIPTIASQATAARGHHLLSMPRDVSELDFVTIPFWECASDDSVRSALSVSVCMGFDRASTCSCSRALALQGTWTHLRNNKHRHCHLFHRSRAPNQTKPTKRIRARTCWFGRWLLVVLGNDAEVPQDVCCERLGGEPSAPAQRASSLSLAGWRELSDNDGGPLVLRV